MKHVLLLTLLLLPLASSQATDPEGDVNADSYDNEVPFPSAPAVDLVGFSLLEGDDFTFAVEVAGAAHGPDGMALDEAEVDIVFPFGRLTYVVRMGRHTAGTTYGELHVVDLLGPRLVTELDHDVTTPHLTATVPRDVLLDETGAPPRTGHVIGPFELHSRSQARPGGPDPDAGFFCCRDAVVLRDSMEAPAHVVASGGGTSDGLLLTSPAPYRLSNGGATTIVYILEASNPGPAPVSANVTVAAPAPFQVEHPLVPLVLGAGENASFPVVVHTPDGHGHGSADTVTVTLAGDGASASTVLGIRYADVPQPAGHHDTLYFHSHPERTDIAPALEALGYWSGMVSMNTLQEDPDDAGAPIDSTHSEFGGNEARWDICLLPGLGLGLQFDLNDTGELTLPVSAGRPYGEVTFTGRLLRFTDGPLVCDATALRGAGTEEVLGTLGASIVDPMTGPTVTLPFTPSVARAPYEPGSVLMLELVASFPDADSQGPGPMVIEPGGNLRLPLLEYADAPPLIVFEEPAAPDPTMKPSPGPTDGSRDSPGFGWAWLALVAMAVIISRSRRE